MTGRGIQNSDYTCKAASNSPSLSSGAAGIDTQRIYLGRVRTLPHTVQGKATFVVDAACPSIRGGAGETPGLSAARRPLCPALTSLVPLGPAALPRFRKPKTSMPSGFRAAHGKKRGQSIVTRSPHPARPDSPAHASPPELASQWNQHHYPTCPRARDVPGVEKSQGTEDLKLSPGSE